MVAEASASAEPGAGNPPHDAVTAEHASQTDDPSAQAARRASEIARSSALGQVTANGLSGHSLLTAMGGVRGLVEALVPGIVFLILFTVTGNLVWSVAAPAALSVAFIVARLIARQSAMPAVAGLIGAAISGFLALRTGEGSDYFIVGFYTNAAYGVAFLISVLVGWPLIGLIAGLLFGAGKEWRAQPGVRRWMNVVTIAWAAFFGLRLAIQLPLYFADQVVALGVTRLIMGTPMYAILIVVTALFVRSVFRAAGFGGEAASDDDTTT